MDVRLAKPEDFEKIWPIFHEIVAAGDTYAYKTGTSKEQAFDAWMSRPRQTFIVIDQDQVLASYYIKTNHDGPGSHVCNCGYMVSALAQGRGIATTMCEHSQNLAVSLGYKAMQFNFVAASNSAALRLWRRLGFDIVGTLPNAFNHPKQGLVDAHIMYKWLD